jgi:hypothetical protein
MSFVLVVFAFFRFLAIVAVSVNAVGLIRRYRFGAYSIGGVASAMFVIWYALLGTMDMSSKSQLGLIIVSLLSAYYAAKSLGVISSTEVRRVDLAIYRSVFGDRFADRMEEASARVFPQDQETKR